MAGRESSDILTPDAGSRLGSEAWDARSDATGSKAESRPTSNVSQNTPDQNEDAKNFLTAGSNRSTSNINENASDQSEGQRNLGTPGSNRPTSNASENQNDRDKEPKDLVTADSNLSAEQNTAAESTQSGGRDSQSSQALDSRAASTMSPHKEQQQKRISGGHRVSLPNDTTPSATTTPPKKRVTSSRRRMERELERMRAADENERLRKKDLREKEVKKAIAAMYDRKRKEGVTLTRDVEESRAAIRKIMVEEERMALEKDQKELRKETKDIQDQIDEKYGLKDKKKGPDLLALADDFYQGKVKDKDGLPEQVRRELTNQEITDLKMVFDMFDLKGRGYITANDVKRAASMLGFKAKKQVFKEMIDEMTGERPGRVTFNLFLQFVVRGQGDGNDPLEDIMQCFRLLDKGQKGYLTREDIREAADAQKLPLSNRAIREMIQEADISGDARVTSDEFVHIMLQTSMFHATR